MTSHYTRLQVVCNPDFSEILMAEIAEAGFDTFMETDNGFEAFTEEKKVDHFWLNAIKEKYQHVQPLLFFEERIQKQNWNKEWEKNVDPVIVDDQCLIRAAFHNIPGSFPYEIIITPKMSFGTGHHQTTHLMIKAQLSIDHHQKLVMDAGCGTAILSIMARKRGAKHVEAFDIDDWSIENGRENVELNHCDHIHIRQGHIRNFEWPDSFDLLLANINKNVLLDEMNVYSHVLRSGGQLLISGFYESDIDDLERVAAANGLRIRQKDSRETWASLLLEKVG